MILLMIEILVSAIWTTKEHAVVTVSLSILLKSDINYKIHTIESSLSRKVERIPYVLIVKCQTNSKNKREWDGICLVTPWKTMQSLVMFYVSCSLGTQWNCGYDFISLCLSKIVDLLAKLVRHSTTLVLNGNLPISFMKFWN